MPTLLLIEDEPTLARNIRQYLERHSWSVDVAGTAEEGLARLGSVGPDVVILDFQLPAMDGLAALASLRERDAQVLAVMLTGHGSVQLAVDAMKAGAADFLSKPVELSELKRVLERLMDQERARNELSYYQDHARAAGGLEEIVGESPAMLALKRRIRQFARAEAPGAEGAPPILVQGETGTGKELVARACHFESARAGRPFIEVNCAAIPNQLLEAELFGYERGAFTGAEQRKVGLIESADRGSLFLEEIGEADVAVQAKLLRVLEDQRIRRLGSVQERRVNVRIIAATNQLLEEHVKSGRFRADLFYRLHVIRLNVPALRERGEDLNLLASHFLDHFAQRYRKGRLRLTQRAREEIAKYYWPGNVRELRNVMEQAVLLATGEEIDIQDLALVPAAVGWPKGAESTQPSKLQQSERALVLQALHRSGWNVARAARMLGITRDQLRYRMEKQGLERPAEPDRAPTDLLR